MGYSSGTFKYFAFICYKSEDLEWAEWLHQELELYQFPSAVAGTHPELPDRISPVFHDTTDLTGNLSERIHEALDESRFLIVICSPRATNSQWIAEEITTFIEEGRHNAIIPFIVEGTPYARDPRRECFPKPLRDLKGDKSREQVGIKIADLGEQAAAIKVVTRLFPDSGLDFRQLWDCQQEMLEKRDRALHSSISRFCAEKAIQLCREGDQMTARRIVLETLPKDLKQPDRTYTPEAERALRLASMNRSQIIRQFPLPEWVFRLWQTTPPTGISTTDSPKIKVTFGNHGEIRIGRKRLVYGRFTCAAFSQDGEYLLTGDMDGTVQLWRPRQNPWPKLLCRHEAPLLAVSFEENDEAAVSIPSKGEVRISPLRRDADAKSYPLPTDIVHAAANRHEQALMIDIQGRIRFLGLRSGISFYIRSIRPELVTHIATSDRTRPSVFAVFCQDTTVRVIDIGQPYFVPDSIRLGQYASFSPDGSMIISTHYGDLQFRSADDGRLLGHLRVTNTGYVQSFHFFPDGHTAYTVHSDGNAALWNIREKGIAWEKIQEGPLENRPEEVLQIRDLPHPDGLHSASVTDGNLIRIRNMKTDAVIAEMECPVGDILHLAFNPAGDQLLAVVRDKGYALYAFPPLQELMDRLRSQILPLSRQEREQYHLDQ